MAVKVREKPKGSGVWWVFIDHNGKRKAKKIGRDKRAAQEVAKRLEAKLTLGDVGLFDANAPKPLTFKEYAETWENVTLPATCKNSTMKDYKSIMRIHILPFFGKMEVNEISRMMVKKFLMEKIKDGLAPSTVSHMKSCIAGTLSIAVDEEVISANPALTLGKIFHKKNVQKDIDPLTTEELAALLSTYQEHFPEHYPLALTLARTGMRFGEGLALKWKDIDFERRLIEVRRTYSLQDRVT
jgi:integrase